MTTYISCCDYLLSLYNKVILIDFDQFGTKIKIKIGISMMVREGPVCLD